MRGSREAKLLSESMVTKISIAGFTLIELIIVIGVISVLAGGLLIILNPFAQLAKARDAQRKSDLHQIKLLLEQYYNDHQRYPPIPNGGSPAAGNYGCVMPNCYDFSYPINTAWIPELVPAYTPKLPVDPLNTLWRPWHDNPPQYSYAYGNVSTDGQHYDLVTLLENPKDPDRCGMKNYIYEIGTVPPGVPWCVAFGGDYSNQVYAVDQ